MNNIEYEMPGGAIYNIPGSKVQMAMATAESSNDVFDDDTTISTAPVPGYPDERYVLWGADNQLPFNIIRLIGENQVMSQNKLFNVLTCYGSGIQYKDRQTSMPSMDRNVRSFIIHNSLQSMFLEQSTDMKYFFFAVAVIILSKDGKQIVQVRHKEACYTRLQVADKHGKINHIYYANWKNQTVDKVERVQLLDFTDPYGELEVLMGRAPGADGNTFERTRERKFAVICRFPTPGFQYYPVPYYTSIFRGYWYDIMRLIGVGKRAKLRNHTSVKYQVEVHKDYWTNICRDENITDPVKRQERIKKEKENIQNFVAGIENSGKVWITGYYIDPNGREVRMVRVTTIDNSKEGGDWSDDIQESSNMCCYGDNIHPNLVGATPGKSQSNNSGSDKRELFTLKQSLEIAFHNLMIFVHEMVIMYNGWDEKVYPDIPIILLTTLDQNTDAKKVSTNPNEQDPNQPKE